MASKAGLAPEKAGEGVGDNDGPDMEAVLRQLNAGLGEYTPFKLALEPPESLIPTPTNAHYMPKRMFDTLSANIKRDGNLSSLPLCWKRADGRYELLSGNHRVQSAITAKIAKILFLYTDQALSQGQKLSMQLSHNAINGMDNASILNDLWKQIDTVEWKIYSGLDDEVLKTMESVQISRINEAPLRMEELVLLFLPSEMERIPELLKMIGKSNKVRLAASYADWDKFFDMLLTFKECEGILNTATAIGVMIDIVSEYLENKAVPSEKSEQKEVLSADLPPKAAEKSAKGTKCLAAANSA